MIFVHEQGIILVVKAIFFFAQRIIKHTLKWSIYKAIWAFWESAKADSKVPIKVMRNENVFYQVANTKYIFRKFP